jgi:hypothetical protein
MDHVLCEVHIKEVEVETRLHESSRDRDWVDKVLGKVSARNTSARVSKYELHALTRI